MKKTQQLLNLSSQLTEVAEEMNEKRIVIETLSDALEQENIRIITSSIADETEFNDVKEDVTIVHKATRKLGQRFFNLFKITFTVQFAGVTLIHWTIPKVTDEGQIINR